MKVSLPSDVSVTAPESFAPSVPSKNFLSQFFIIIIIIIISQTETLMESYKLYTQGHQQGKTVQLGK